MDRGRWISVLVFGASALGLVGLEYVRASSVTVYGVGDAPSYAHRAPDTGWDATVAEVLVTEGARVQAGAPLLRLARGPLDAELGRRADELRRVTREARAGRRELAARQGLDDAQRASLRMGLDGDTDALGGLELERLAALRDAPLPAEVLARLRAYHGALLGAREAHARYDELARGLDIVALTDGVVVSIARVGERIAPGASAAQVSPERAREVVAYLPAETRPSALLDFGSNALIAEFGGARCEARIRDAVAPVRAAPEQLLALGAPSHGWPVRVTLPEECPLGVGQAVEVTLPVAHR